MPLVQDPRKNWDCAVSVVLHGAMLASVWWAFGFSVLAFTLLIPLVISAALGAYLFFAQHNCPGMRICADRRVDSLPRRAGVLQLFEVRPDHGVVYRETLDTITCTI